MIHFDLRMRDLLGKFMLLQHFSHRTDARMILVRYRLFIIARDTYSPPHAGVAIDLTRTRGFLDRYRPHGKR